MKNAAPLMCNKGNVLTALLGVIGIIGVLGVSAYGLIHGPVRSAAVVTMRSKAQAELVLTSRMMIQAATDTDADGVPEAPAFDPAATPTIANAGGIPLTVGAGKRDAWGTPYAYCVWDHGSVNSSADRLTGDASGYGDKLLLAIVSAGPDRVFQTSCDDAPTYLTEDVNSDDIIDRYTFAQAEAMGLWEKRGVTDKIEYTGGNVLVGTAPVGTAQFQVEGDAEIGGNLTVGGAAAFHNVNIEDDMAAGVLDMDGANITATAGVSAASIVFPSGPVAKVTNLKANLLDDEAADFYLDPNNLTNTPAQFDPDDFDSFTEDNSDDLYFTRVNATTLQVRAHKLNAIQTPDYAPNDGDAFFYNPSYNGGSWTWWQPTQNADLTTGGANTWAVTVRRLQGRDVSNAAPGANQVMGWDGAQWKPMDLVYGTGDANTVGFNTGVNFLGTASGITSGNCANNSVPKYVSGTWYCLPDNGGVIGLPMDLDTVAAPEQIVAHRAGGTEPVMSFGTPTGGTLNNTILGIRAGENIDYSSGDGGNVLLGYEAARNMTTGEHNVAVGYRAGLNLSTGSRNIAVGNRAGQNLGAANEQTLIGYEAGMNLNTGAPTVAIGYRAAYLLEEAHNPMVIIGSEAGYNKPNGYNILIGRRAGYSLESATSTEASRNVFVGSEAASSARATVDSVVLGYNILAADSGSCGNDNDGANESVYIGSDIGASGVCLTGDANVVLGNNVLTTGTTAHSGVYIGNGVADVMNGSNVEHSVAIGHEANAGVQTAPDAVSIGYRAARRAGGNQIQRGHVAIGANAMGGAAPSGDYNTTYSVVIGDNAGQTMRNNMHGHVLIGSAAGYSLETGTDNVMLGTCTGCFLAHGAANVLIGERVGAPTGGFIAISLYSSPGVSVNLTQGNGNVFIGRGFGPAAGNTDDHFYLSTSRAQHVLWGPMTSGNWTRKGTLTQLSDARLKENIRPITQAWDKIKEINGVFFKWKKGFKEDDRTYLGVKAQEVERVAPEVVFENGQDETTAYKSVSYGHLVPLLIEDMKDRQKRIDALRAKIAELKTPAK